MTTTTTNAPRGYNLQLYVGDYGVNVWVKGGTTSAERKANEREAVRQALSETAIGYGFVVVDLAKA